MSLHSIADQDQEPTMSPLLSAMSRYFRRPHRDSGLRRTGNRQARRQPPCLEVLEDRTVPTVSISVANASLTEIGNVSPLVASASGGLSGPKDLVLGPDG